jgi:hypothetical protein
MAGEASWVVYQMSLPDNAAPRMAVCEQAEWDAMERVRPGRHTLVRGGIPTEAEAELLARGTSGDPAPRPARRGRHEPPAGPLATTPPAP